MTSPRRLALDYLAPVPPAWPGWLLLCAGAALAIGTLAAGIDARRQADELAALARQNAPASRIQPAPDPERERHAAAEAKAAALALGRLTFPWQRALDAVERNTPSEVALLGLQPDMARRQVTLTGQARDAESMLSYWKAIAAAPEIRGAHIARYEAGEGGARAPVRFQIQAELAESP